MNDVTSVFIGRLTPHASSYSKLSVAVSRIVKHSLLLLHEYVRTIVYIKDGQSIDVSVTVALAE